MKNLFIILLLVTGVMSCTTKNKLNQNTVKETVPTMANQKVDSVSYSLGVLIAQNLKQQGFKNLNGDDLASAINDVLADKPTIFSPEEANKCVTEYQQAEAAKAFAKNKEEGAAFLETNGKRAEVTTLLSGLQYEVINAGTGASPAATDKVTVHYHGTLLDGTIFDSSVDRGEPASFPVNGVIQGWVEALQLMKEGDKWKLFIPADLAYGERGAGKDIGPFATLIFEVELLKIN